MKWFVISLVFMLIHRTLHHCVSLQPFSVYWLHEGAIVICVKIAEGGGDVLYVFS